MTTTAPRARFSICVVENSHKELLFLKRAPHLKLGPGMWAFPAGHIEDEAPLACAMREMHEEIGADHKVELTNSHEPVRDSLYGGIYEVYLFQFYWLHGTISLNDEHTEYRWVDQKQFANLDVMDGIDEDLFLLDVWPYEALHHDRLPPSMQR